MGCVVSLWGAYSEPSKMVDFRNPRVSECPQGRAVPGVRQDIGSHVSKTLVKDQAVIQPLRGSLLRDRDCPQAPLGLRCRFGARSAWGFGDQSSPRILLILSCFMPVPAGGIRHPPPSCGLCSAVGHVPFLVRGVGHANLIRFPREIVAMNPIIHTIRAAVAGRMKSSWPNAE